MSSSFTLLLRTGEESWSAFLRRMRDTEGELVVILSSADNNHLLQQEDRAPFIEGCAKLRYRLRLATKEPIVARDARKAGIRVIEKTRQLRQLLTDHEKMAEALRFFSPSLWRQQWRSRLQTIGLLSVPKVRIWILVLLSAALFSFVIFRLLPSADVLVWARSDLVTQTMNITLVASGANVPLSPRVRTQPLVKIAVKVKKSIVYNDISPQFTGTNARVQMTLINQSTEPYSFRAKTRLVNQAGMVFRLQDSVTIPPGGKTTVAAKADDLDLYDKIIGNRGNVPAGLEWDIPGITLPEQKLVYGKNLQPATGGTTSQRMVLEQKDIDAGQKRLKQELLVAAKQLVEEERQARNARDPQAHLELLAKDDVIASTYTGFVLPTNLLGQPVNSITIQGELDYMVPAYDLQRIQTAYDPEIQAHAAEGKRLLPDSVNIDPEKVIIIEFADDGTWIKITADVIGTEQYVLDPLTPTGATFGKKVRDAIAGLSVRDAQRILTNFPEVDRIEIHTWPPWSGELPAIPSNISITPQ